MEYAGIRQLMSAKLQTELDEKLSGSVKNNLRRSYGEQRAKNRFWPISGMLTATTHGLSG